MKMQKRLHPEWAQENSFQQEFEDAVSQDPITAFLSSNYGLIVMANLMLNPEYQEQFLRMH